MTLVYLFTFRVHEIRASISMYDRTVTSSLFKFDEVKTDKPSLHTHARAETSAASSTTRTTMVLIRFFSYKLYFGISSSPRITCIPNWRWPFMWEKLDRWFVNTRMQWCVIVFASEHMWLCVRTCKRINAIRMVMDFSLVNFAGIQTCFSPI